MPVRVLIGPMPKLLKELVDSYLAESDEIELLGTPAPGQSYEDAARDQCPDVLVVGQDDLLESPPFCTLLCELPNLHILALRRDGSAAALSELRLQQHWIRSYTPERIIAEVVKAGRRSRPQMV